MSPMLAGAQRILILGSPGAGKSTLARQLARSMALSLVHLDALYWAQGTPPAAASGAARWNRPLHSLPGSWTAITPVAWRSVCNVQMR